MSPLVMLYLLRYLIAHLLPLHCPPPWLCIAPRLQACQLRGLTRFV